MTSKISFNKFLKENIRQRGWLAALSCILQFLMGPVYTILSLENMLSDTTDLDLKQIGLFFPGLLNGAHTMLFAALIFLLAILCAVTGFSYLHSAEKTDFYHSLPVSRTQWFRISYTGGLFLFLIPYLISSLCTLVIGSSKGILNTEVLAASCLAILGGILGFLVIYHTTIFAMMLTGKIVTGILAALALSVYGSMAAGLIPQLASSFFATYSGNSHILPEQASKYVSPVTLFTQLLGQTSSVASSDEFGQPVNSSYIFRRFYQNDTNGNLLSLLLLTLLFLVILGLLSDYLYRKRSSEAAGNALAYPKTAPFIKILIAIPTALYCGLLISSLYNGGKKWILIISILSVVLLCAVIEFIYHMDLRKLLTGKISSLISIAGVIGILCIVQFDLFGYDSWLPEEKALDNMSVTTDSFSGYFTYPNLQNHSWGPDLLDSEEAQLTDFAPLYALAQEGIANVKAGITPDEVYQLDSSYDYIVLTMQFGKTSGKSVYRNYAVDKEHVLDALTQLCEDENYRKVLFPVFYLDYDAITGIQLTDIYYQPETLNLTHEQQRALLDAYKKDVLAVSIADLQKKDPIGELSVEMPDTWSNTIFDNTQYTMTVPSFYLYDDYENSLTLLKEYGYSLRTELAAEDVIQITKTVYKDTDTDYGNPESEEYTVTDPDEIAEILSQIKYHTGGILGGKSVSSQSVDILLKGESASSYYSLP